MSGPSAHHELGASGAYRWLVCHGSVAAQRGLPESTSFFAEEGTSAHELGEASLLFWKLADGSTRAIQEWRKKATEAGYDTKEMIREVEKYTDYVKDLCEDEPDRLSVETQVSFGDVIPDGFGTADATCVKVIGDTVRRLDVADLKYGKGKKVYATNNPQLRLYGYGVIRELIAKGVLDEEFDDFDLIPIGLHICQPRLDHFDCEEMSVADLIEWAETVVAPIVKKINDGDETRVAGDGCDFCKVQATCRTKAEKQAADLDMDFDDFVEEGPATPSPDDLTPEELGKLFSHKKETEKWFKAIEAHIYAAIQRGESIPGWKLVQGNNAQKWTVTEEEVLEAFKGQRALKQDEYAPRKLLTAAQAAKLLSEKSKIRYLIAKEPGRPVLADESSKKPALEFGKLEDEFDDL